ncbi:hypothetical protein Patl1_05285 [Pistacia atlantica]|uniref:Uncharacterized protein n=1 Tax=Pistacia atlantica TaxID=434234 RepID=A0ACC1BWV8_9ROSI|nr:hypothetical protein Patl1_05285 [Pistacia atlantica]
MISTANAAPNWLDRLRSTKGFPTGDNLDLDHFLRNNDHDTPKPNSFESNLSDCKRVVENGDEKEEEWLGIMTNVLSDLFNMGEPNPRFKKSCRKQANPKLCLVSTEDQSSGCMRKAENAPVEIEAKNIEIEEDGERELVGYSRNEVTVIDTSCAEWKFEKLVFRKRNVWKVREKKGKSRVIGRKKRKANGCDGIVHAKKKLKLSNGAPSKHVTL